MEYMAYAKSLRDAAEYFQKNRPELPDVVATYKKSADVIESLLSDADVDHAAHGKWIQVVRCKDCVYRSGVPGQPNILCGQMKDNDFCSYGKIKD